MVPTACYMMPRMCNVARLLAPRWHSEAPLDDAGPPWSTKKEAVCFRLCSLLNFGSILDFFVMLLSKSSVERFSNVNSDVWGFESKYLE